MCLTKQVEGIKVLGMGENMPERQLRLESEIRAADMYILFPGRSHSMVVGDLRLPLDDGRFISVLKREVFSPQIIRWIATEYFKSSLPVRNSVNQLVSFKTLVWMQDQFPQFTVPKGTSVTITHFDLNNLFNQKDVPLMRVLAEKTRFDELEQALYRYNLLEEGESAMFHRALFAGLDDPLVYTIWHNGGKVHG